jgi:hypothetical protein
MGWDNSDRKAMANAVCAPIATLYDAMGGECDLAQCEPTGIFAIAVV